MPARNSTQVRYLTDPTSQPPRRHEVTTATGNALAFRVAATYPGPDHRSGTELTVTWAVIPQHAPDPEPVFIYYDRAEAVPFGIEGRDTRYAQLGDAMEAAA